MDYVSVYVVLKHLYLNHNALPGFLSNAMPCGQTHLSIEQSSLHRSIAIYMDVFVIPLVCW